MKTRTLGRSGPEVSAVGLGCMSFSHAYGHPPAETQSQDVLLKALDLGYTFFDTAAIYGLGHNETLVGKTIGSRRSEFTLASKGGLGPVAGQRGVSSKPADIKRVAQ